MKRLFFPILILTTIVLTACSSTSMATSISSTSSDLSVETELAVGTLKLAGTAQDVSAEQVKELVVYWQVYKELSQSETAAQEEKDGLIAQIQETMTDAQIQAIDDMNITQQDVMASMQGVTVVSSNASDSTVSAPSRGSIPDGAPPDGGVPADGGMLEDMGGAVPVSSNNQASPASASTAGISSVPVPLINAVIESLQQKLAAA